ncbi:MAG: hypothetical protein J6I55_02080 [Ruminococcus sp.]|nr:hypothetical protein [Ruminococcus sp.]
MIFQKQFGLLTAAAILLSTTAFPVSAEENLSVVQESLPTAQEIVDDIYDISLTESPDA